jgi:hypothetical protein
MLVYRGPNQIYTHNDTDRLRRMIENDSDTASSSTHFSYKLERYLMSSGLGDLLDILNCSLTLVIIMFYIISTYTAEQSGITGLIDTVEIFLCVFLIAHFSLKLYCSQNRFVHLFTIDQIIDYGTIIPILLAKQSIFDDQTLHYLKLL